MFQARSQYVLEEGELEQVTVRGGLGGCDPEKIDH